jgi:predicted acyltransferase
MSTAASADASAAAPRSTPLSAGADRLQSLDALRGFDMFWIIGGSGLVLGLAKLIAGGETPDWLPIQLEHPAWNGCTFCDLIFPLFVFIVGAALPFSLGKRIERGENLGRVYWRVFRRTVLLVLLGLLYQGLLENGFSANLRWPSVLGRIGLAYGCAAVITLNTSSFRARVAWIAILLLGYWATMMWVPVPDYGAGNPEPGKTLADYIDQHLLPGRLYCGNHDPEGLLSTIPAVATCLLGVLAGQWLRRPRPDGYRKAAVLLASGAACLALGWLWSMVVPLNKNLWTSSFVLWTGGWSLLLLSVFYLVIDVLGWKKWAFFFVVVGANAITIYLACRFVDFSAVGKLLFGHSPLHHAILPACSRLAVEWLLLYVLYRGRVFLRL